MRTLLTLLLVATVVTPAHAQGRYARLDPIVYAALDRAGVSRDDVIRIRYQARTSGGEENRRLIGVDAWVSLTTCEKGSLIVGMDRRGMVREVYTRQGCQVEGVDSTC